MATLLVAACGAAPTSTPTPTSPLPTTTLPSSPVPTPVTAPSSSAGPTIAPTVAPTAVPTAVSTASSPPKATVAPASAAPANNSPLVYVFNASSQDVTIVDTATNTVVATRPLGAAVSWLSNTQRYWDGTNVWTFDYPNNQVQAIAIDPKAVKVVKTIETRTAGPGHSLMLTPDLKTAFVNAAGSDLINVIDLKGGAVVDQIATGHFP